MGFFDRFRKKKVVEPQTVVIENQYHRGYDSFRYKYGVNAHEEGSYVNLTINDEINLSDNQKYYECHLRYDLGRPTIFNTIPDKEFEGYQNVIIGLDKDRMVKDEAYAKYVLENVLNTYRIKQLHKIEFGVIEGIKSGNYVGTVVEGENGLTTVMDEEICRKVASSPKTKAMHDSYDSLFRKPEETKQNELEPTNNEQNVNQYEEENVEEQRRTR